VRITVATIGSEGDVEPALALALGLAADGAEVTFVGPPAFREGIERRGLGYRSLEPPIAELEGPDERETKLDRIRKFRKGRVHVIRQFDRVVEAAREADLLLAAITFAPAALTARDLHGVAIGVFNVVVPFVPTGEVANPWLFALPFGRPARRLSYTVFEELLWQPVRAPVNRWRRGLGLPPFPTFGFFRRIYRERVPVLLAWSPCLWPRHADYPPSVEVTGSWLPAAPTCYEPPPEIVRFLDENPEPICITFGSNPIADRERLLRAVAGALRANGRRALLVAAASGLDQAEGGTGELVIVRRIPFRWLFPRLSLVVHHGGCGVTNLALEAGVPAIVVPTRPDQLALGRRLEQLGVAARPIALRALTADKLASAIGRVLGDPTFRANARRIGGQMAREDGVARAVALVRGFGAGAGQARATR
jgi:sterol 3beta-glucosyltransferase